MKHIFTIINHRCHYRAKPKRSLFWAIMPVLLLPSLLLADAIEDYTKAIKLNPNDAVAYNNRGIAYKNKGQNDKAIEDYHKAIQLNPNYNRSLFYTPSRKIIDEVLIFKMHEIW